MIVYWVSVMNTLHLHAAFMASLLGTAERSLEGLWPAKDTAERVLSWYSPVVTEC
jgi:hypothetical protein